MNRVNVLNNVIKTLQAKNYLEIGVNKGKLFFNIEIDKKVGVDPKFSFNLKNRVKKKLGIHKGEYFEMTSDEFFKNHVQKVFPNGLDVVFVDGLHTFDQAYRDIENSLKYLNENGVILIHDCNPLNEASAYPVKNSFDEVKALAKNGLPGWMNCWCGDVWKVIPTLNSLRNDVKAFTIDLDWGIGVVKRVRTHRTDSMVNKLSYEDILKLKYVDLEQNRQDILQLKPVSFLNEFLAN